MKLAISNLAWEPSEDDAVASLVREHGFSGIEIAPTKVWPVPLESTRAQRAEYRRCWSDRGLQICAMQSLLFGHPECELFQTSAARQAMATRLKGIIDLAADVGAEVLVFGSPGNRKRETLDEARALEIAIPFFRDLGTHAMAAGVTFCIEPNPPVYGCDFITTSDAGRLLVDAVGEPGFGLHLDGAGLLLAGEDPAAATLRHAHHFRHFHVSAPQLAPVNAEVPVAYGRVAEALREADYERWVSIEMRAQPAGGDNLGPVRAALRFVRDTFVTPK